MGNDTLNLTIADEAARTGERLRSCADDVSNELRRPSSIYKPVLSMDGNQWCALYGADLQNGVAGFGDSPADAMMRFDVAWYTQLKPKGTP
jgi:hypothetical protein